jgi:uncharacterized protein (UPF0332 family)
MNNHEVADLLAKAKQSIEAAELLFKDGYWDFSASRAYYAMFYSLEALFLDRNVSYSKHSAVIAAFGKDFIKTGIFDKKFHKYVLDAFDIRNIGDYGVMNAVFSEQAKELIANAKELIDCIRKYLLNLQTS